MSKLNNCILPQHIHYKLARSNDSQKCCECGVDIPKYKQFIQNTGVWNGRLLRFNVCIECNASRVLYEVFHSHPVPFGCLKQWMKEEEMEQDYRMNEVVYDGVCPSCGGTTVVEDGHIICNTPGGCTYNVEVPD